MMYVKNVGILTGNHNELENDSDNETLPRLKVGEVSPGVLVDCPALDNNSPLS